MSAISTLPYSGLYLLIPMTLFLIVGIFLIIYFRSHVPDDNSFKDLKELYLYYYTKYIIGKKHICVIIIIF